MPDISGRIAWIHHGRIEPIVTRSDVRVPLDAIEEDGDETP